MIKLIRLIEKKRIEIKMAYEEKTLDSKIVYKGKIFNIRRDTVLAVNGKNAYRDILEHNGAAVLLPITKQGKIVLVRQWRQARKQFMLELPAGKVDPGETFEETATRELQEETGYTAENLRYLLTVSPSAGYSEEILKIYLSTELIPGEISLDETEDLDVIECNPKEILQIIVEGKIQDSKTIIGILYAHIVGLL